MFQDISQSLVLVVFLWGPLVNRGIRKGSVDIIHLKKVGRGALATVYGWNGSQCTEGLNTHCIPL